MIDDIFFFFFESFFFESFVILFKSMYVISIFYASIFECVLYMYKAENQSIGIVGTGIIVSKSDTLLYDTHFRGPIDIKED